MLILTRKPGQSIYIGENIRITVINFSKDREQVKFGIEAPDNVPVFREELIKNVREEKTAKKAEDDKPKADRE